LGVKNTGATFVITNLMLRWIGPSCVFAAKQESKNSQILFPHRNTNPPVPIEESKEYKYYIVAR
jgi:hypothetical protein